MSEEDNKGGNENPGPKRPLAALRNAVSGFAADNKQQLKTTALAGVLMGTSALVTPLLTSTLATTACAAATGLGSFWLLSRTGNMTIAGMKAVGEKTKISPLMLGLGLGAMASIPDFFVALRSVFTGAYEIGIGNLVGANVAHVFLILGATAAISGIKPGQGTGWKYNMMAMTGATLGFGGLLAANALTPAAGAGMMALAGAYLAGNYFIAHKDSKSLGVPVEKMIHSHDHDEDEHDHDHDHEHGHAHGKKPHETKKSGWLQAAWSIAGLGGLIYAAHAGVDSASTVALNSGISAATIGTLGVALGSSLPELVISVKAARKGDTDMAVGNILGCNIFNILFVGGALSLAGAQVPASFGTGSTLGLFNLAALGTSAGLMSATLSSGKGAVKKWQGYAGLGIYAAYCATVATLGGYESQAPVKQPLPVQQSMGIAQRPASFAFSRR